MKKALALGAIITAISTNLFFSSAAFAHDEVTGTYPTAGETVEAGQIGVSVTFNEEVMSSPDNSGFEIKVSDSKGAAQPAGCLMAGGNTVSILTSLAADGDYTVDWRSVSNDGHPSEGTFKFTVANTSGYEQEAEDALACPMLLSGEPSPIAYTMDDMKRDATAETPEDNSALIGLGIGAGFIVLGGIATAVTAKVRERRGAKAAKERKDNDDDVNDNFITIIS